MGPIYITNNVPYINSLNGGHSQHAPAGFVERAIVKAVTTDLNSDTRPPGGDVL